MRPILTLLLVLALVMPVPLAVAAWPFAKEEPVTVHVPQPRVGDTARFEEAFRVQQPEVNGGESRSKTVDRNSTLVTLVEGPSRAEDKYGIERETFAYRSDASNASGLIASTRCHQLVGGNESVRVEYLAGEAGMASGSYSSTLGPVDLSSGSYRSTSAGGASFSSGPCPGPLALAGRTLELAEPIAFADVFGWPSPEIPPSGPPLVTEAFGRTAFRYEFQLEEGLLWVVLADGIPVVVEAGYDGGPDARGKIVLVGFQQGHGAEAPAPAGAALPERDPAGSFVSYAPLVIDDSALGLPFPYVEAFAWAVGKPGSEVKAFLDAHPESWLAAAIWTRGTDEAATRSDGTWSMLFRDGGETIVAAVERKSVTIGPVERPLPPVSTYDVPGRAAFSSSQVDPRIGRPTLEEVADGRTWGARVLATGLAAEDIDSLLYYAGSFDGEDWVGLNVQDDGDEGSSLLRYATVDLASGGLGSVFTLAIESESSGLLGPSQGSVGLAPAARVDGLSALVGPELGVAGGAAAATGIAILVGLLKFLVIPFYARLLRTRLLDNPVRARLYERIRAEPGIHLGELVDFTGVGKGATKHHLDQLVAHRYAVELSDDGFTRYYAAGEVPPDVARRAGVLRAGSHQRVYDLYAARPSASLREAAAELGMSAPSVHRSKKKLEAAGLLPAAPMASLEAGEKPTA